MPNGLGWLSDKKFFGSLELFPQFIGFFVFTTGKLSYWAFLNGKSFFLQNLHSFSKYTENFLYSVEPLEEFFAKLGAVMVKLLWPETQARLLSR